MLERYLSPGDGVIDLGANVGHYTGSYATAVGKWGTVIAVEPEAENFRQLVKAVSGYPTVECVNAVIGSDVLFVDAVDRRRSSCWAINRLSEGPEQRPQIETLDALARTVPNLKAIKMDVQGAECHVLDGGQETLARDLVWAVECWPQGLTNAGRSIGELAEQFQAHGYQPIGKWASWDALLDVIGQYDGHKSTDVILKRISPVSE